MARGGQVEARYAIELKGARAIGGAPLSERGDVHQVIERQAGIFSLHARRARVARVHAQAPSVLGRYPIAEVHLSECARLGMAVAHDVDTRSRIHEEVVEEFLVGVLLGHTGPLQHIVERTTLQLGVCRGGVG